MIIGINGRIGSGKDTMGMMLQALTMTQQGNWYNDPEAYARDYEGKPNLKGGWDIKKFAYKLKQMACLFLGVTMEQLESQDFKNSTLGREWSYIEMVGSGRREDGPFGPKTAVIKDMTVREFLQRLGKGVRDSVHEDVWLNALFADYKRIPNHPPGGGMGTNGPTYYPDWIVTDVRYPNEARAIKSRGGVMVRLDRIGNPHPKSEHESETALDDFDFDFKFGIAPGHKNVLLAAKTLISEISSGVRRTR